MVLRDILIKMHKTWLLIENKIKEEEDFKDDSQVLDLGNWKDAVVFT